ncbi:hypothetical protein FJZ19_00020 [Candidatus Pacearchaeota archaeon]|nr:hypothetical protein [Candidatus Pacearchaeota archaeon]
MHHVESEFRARREQEAKKYEQGVEIARGNLTGRFRLDYIPTGVTEDPHTGERKERKQARLSWEIYRENNLIDSGYKFNPFPLEDAVELVFSGVEKILGI